MSSSPLSYAGATRRTWRLLGPAGTLRDGAPWYARAVAGALGCIAVLFAWCLVTLWYGLLLPVLPVVAVWRLTRRGARREQSAERRHRELLEARRG